MNKKQFPNFIDILVMAWNRFNIQFNGLVGASLVLLLGCAVIIVLGVTVFNATGFVFGMMNIMDFGNSIIGIISIFIFLLLAYSAYMTLVIQKIALAKKPISLRNTMMEIDSRELGRAIATLFIVCTTIILGFMAFVIPGIVFAVLSIIMWPIIVDKKAGGVLVFSYAYHYIKGNVAAFTLTSILFSLISSILYFSGGIAMMLLWVLLYVPFKIVFATMLYESLQGGRNLFVSKKSRLKWGVITMIVISFGAFILGYTIISSSDYINMNSNIDMMIDGQGLKVDFKQGDVINGEVNPDSLPYEENIYLDTQ